LRAAGDGGGDGGMISLPPNGGCKCNGYFIHVFHWVPTRHFDSTRPIK